MFTPYPTAFSNIGFKRSLFTVSSHTFQTWFGSVATIAYPRLACHPWVPQALDHLGTGQESTTDLCCRIILKTWQVCESFWVHKCEH